MCSIMRIEHRPSRTWPEFEPRFQSHGTTCAPSICTTHTDAKHNLNETYCGWAFANATMFTVIRDPVERVWSFYNYLSRW